jgi:hypothetical protein
MLIKNMKTCCLICNQEFKNILEHISIRHGVSSVEEYEKKVREKIDKDIKIKEFIEYSEKLMERFRKGEISPEKLRELRAKWEEEHNLK